MRKIIISTAIAGFMFTVPSMAAEKIIEAKIDSFPFIFMPIECPKHKLPILHVRDESGRTIKADAQYSGRTGFISIELESKTDSRRITIEQDCHLTVLRF